MTDITPYREPNGLAAAEGGNVSGLLQLAIEQQVPVETLERLMALYERQADRNAEQAMVEALVGFQAECPPVPRVRTATVRTRDGGKGYEYHFAPLEVIAEVIRPHLQKWGLSYTHDAEVHGDRIKVTCTLQHVLGARRTATFECPFDTSGGKNPLQAVGSARSYGRRYSLLDVLGLMTEEDDDGRAAGRAAKKAEVINAEQLADLEALMDEVKADRGKVLRAAGVDSLDKITLDVLPRIIRGLEQMRGRR